MFPIGFQVPKPLHSYSLFKCLSHSLNHLTLLKIVSNIPSFQLLPLQFYHTWQLKIYKDLTVLGTTSELPSTCSQARSRQSQTLFWQLFCLLSYFYSFYKEGVSLFRSSCILNLEILVVAVSQCHHSLTPLNWCFQADSDHQDLMVQTALIALLLMQMDLSWHLQCFEHLQNPSISHIISIMTFSWLSLVLYIH